MSTRVPIFRWRPRHDVAAWLPDRVSLHMQSYLRLFVIVMVVLASTSSFAKGKRAQGAEPANRDARERAAHKACMEGDYGKGVSILLDLFLESNEADYVFNQGRCYQQNERYQDAISRFREYLRIGSEDLDLAQKHIAECEELAARKSSAEAVPAAPAPPGQSATTAPASPVAAPAAAPAASPPAQAQPLAMVHQAPPTASSGSGLRTSGIVIAAVGAAGLITGVILNVKANSLASSIEPPNSYQQSTESSRKSYETYSWVGYGVGAAAIATGTILYLVGRSQASGESNLAFVPAVGRGIAGAAVRGSF